MSRDQQTDAAAGLMQAILSRRDLEGIVRAVGAELRRRIPVADEVGVVRYHADKHVFEVVAVLAGDRKATNLGVRYRDSQDTPGGFLLKMGKTTMINDFDALKAQAGIDFRSMFPRGFEAGIGALLEREGQVLGFFYVTAREKNSFKPPDRDLIDDLRGPMSLAFDNALACDEVSRLRDVVAGEREYIRAEVEQSWPADGLIGRSRLWKTVLGQIAQVAGAESTVLVQGETGTGKELIARAIHDRSARASKPLIKVNCGALPENLVESELFGHERGSFTGAMGRRIGRFELADGGTIFLDEIGEMPPALQVRLLRVLQEREFERVGGERPIRVDVRVIAATNRDLTREVAAGRFRADLYYRLNVFPIEIPPLRIRPEDAVELVEYFLHRIGGRMGRGRLRLTDGSLQAVQGYSWPGNVRELEHLVERGIILAQGQVVDLQALLMPSPMGMAFPAADARAPEPASPGADSAAPLKERLVEDERAAIEGALAATGGVVGGASGAAARLGMKRQTLQSKIKKYEIDLESFKR